jgi:hypothetical protein
MANRENTILLKRSDVIGKVPLPGDIQLGELALNVADVKLYASGTTDNDIIQIGWDRISRTGDTVTGDFNFIGDFSATTISATTYNNLPISGLTEGNNISLINNNGNYTISVTGVINDTGNTITFTATTIYNSPTSPATGNISGDTTNALTGIVQKIYHNDSVAPTFPAGWVKIYGEYATSIENIIFAEWISGSRVEYWIVNDAPSGFVPETRTLTINGTTQDLSANRTYTIPAVINVGTTSVTSGTDGRVFFQAGGVIQQDGAFFWDNTNKRLGVGATPNTAVRLDVRAQGALSTDVAFRVRNSADTANILTVIGSNFVGINTDSPRVVAGSSSVGLSIKNGATELFSTFQNGGVMLGAGAIATNFNLNAITGVAIGLNAYSWQSSVSIGQNVSASSTTTVAIGNNTSAGGSSGSNIVSIGNNVNAATISGGGAKNVCIGSNLIAGRDNYEQIIIGADLGNRASSAGSLNVNRNIYIGGNLDNAVNSRTGVISLGFGVSSASKINQNIDNSFSLYFSDNNRSFFVNKNTNIVMKSLGALIAGTDFDSSATNTFTVYNGTTPSINTADSFQQYSADITAGNAAPHFRTENGSIVKLYQEAAVTTAQGIATALASQGLLATSTIVPTVQSVVTAATVTPVAGNEEVVITAQDGALTIANPTGTWYQGQDLIIRIKDDGTGRAITWDSDYRAIGVTLPTTTVANKLTYVGIIYNSTDSKWDVLGVSQEA